VTFTWTIDEVFDTSITRMLGIRYPIIQGAMGYIARHELVAAVSEAGGLGVLATIGRLDADGLRDELRSVKALTSAPFGVNFVFPSVGAELMAAGSQNTSESDARRLREDLIDKVDVAISEGVRALGSGLGPPPPEVVARCKQAGVICMVQVGAVRHAIKATQAGADLLIAQGWEAGGHNAPVATMALVPQVVRASQLPVAAAGGIAHGGGLVAALALGASAVYMGTVFAASTEARAHPNFKDAIVASTDQSTVVTRAASGKPSRMIRNGFVEYFDQHPDEIDEFPIQYVRNEALLHAVRVEGRIDEGPLIVGQIGGLVERVETAAEIMARVVQEATQVLETGLASR
jgi:enoyl-[acyl-carrier protein] reductase II